MTVYNKIAEHKILMPLSYFGIDSMESVGVTVYNGSQTKEYRFLNGSYD